MKPILFNTEMVRAILEGRKTVTRRVMKPQPEKSADSPYECIGGRFAFRIGEYACTDQYKPPYRPGDILYVRETWCPVDGGGYIYKAGFQSDRPLWRPSIHMPREAARIFLRVKDVRVERLQDMQPYDIAFEGYRRQRNFIALWDSTIKPADRALYGWAANPWVWVIEFERCEKPQSQLEKDILRYYSPAVLGLGETERTMKENDAGGACAAGAGCQKADR